MAFGIANKSYVSTIQLLDKREINPKSLDIHNEEGLTDILSIAGRYKPTTMAIYHHYVNDPLFSSGTQNGVATGTGTVADPLVITLTAGTSGFARKTDLVRLKNGKVGYVTNVTRGAADVITVRPVNGSVTLASAAGDVLSFFSGTVGEKSLAVENRRYGLTKYLNMIQEFREVNEESDIQTMSAIEVTFDGQARYHVKNLADKYIMHKAAVNGALIAGQISMQNDGITPAEFGSSTQTLVDPIGGGNAQTTRGLDEYVSTLGISDTVDVLDSIDMDDFEQHIALLLSKKAPKDYMVYSPTKAQIKIDNTLGGLNNLVTNGRLALGGKEFEFGVKKLSYGGFTFQFANLPILDNVDIFGSADISKNIYLVPTDKVKVRGGGQEDRLQVRYMKHNIAAKDNKGSDIWGEWHTGGAAPTGATNDELIWRTNWITYQGLEVLGAQHFSKIKVLT